MEDLIGTRLGQYELQSVIRHGGMSTVYRAYQESLDRHVAIKVLAQTRDPAFVARFQREARAIALLQHPNILPVHDYGEQDGLLYLVMQYVGDGATLADQLQGPLEPVPALRITNHILAALGYAHDLGVVHRDVKPQNVLMASPRWPLLADFGIAKLLNETATEKLTVHGFVVGTAAYMAPEQATGDAVDAQTDLYSLGVVLYEVVTGQVPFDADTPVSVLAKHAFEQPRRPREIRPHVPAEVERIILRALAKDRRDRYRTAAEMSADVEAVTEHLSRLGPLPRPPAGEASGPTTELVPDAAAGPAPSAPAGPAPGPRTEPVAGRPQTPPPFALSVGAVAGAPAPTELYEAAVRDYVNGQFAVAITRLEGVLAADPAHEGAADLLRAARERVGGDAPSPHYAPAAAAAPTGPDRRVRGGLIAALLAGVLVLAGGTVAAFQLVGDGGGGSSTTVGAGAPGASVVETGASATAGSVTDTFPVDTAGGAATGDVGTLRFSDRGAVLDQVTLIAGGLGILPDGSQYEAWLTGDGGEARLSIGMLSLDEAAAGRLEFVDPMGANLLETYDSVEITVEPSPDSNTGPSGEVAAAGALGPEALNHLRHLLVAFETNVDSVGLAVGLVRQSRVVDIHARALLDSHNSGDEVGVAREAEALVNILEGPQGEHYGDVDDDGVLTDDGDGFGLLLNGDQPGYIQGTLDHATLAAEAPDSGDAMTVYAEHVTIAVENAGEWAAALDEVALRIATGESSDVDADVRQAVALADRLLNGADLDGNEVVDPLPGEGGARTANVHAHYMADIVISA